ncbi:hypothetical protein ACFX2B_000428 [Malus domestica]
MRSSPLPGVIENANSVENDSRLLRFPLTNLKGFLQRRRPELETDGRLPKISKSKRILFLGNVNMVLSNVTIYEIDVGPSHFELGDDGIAVIDSGVTCNLNMNWHYSDSTWIAPVVVVVSDEGRASIQVWFILLCYFSFSGLIFCKLIGEVCWFLIYAVGF